MVLIPHFSGYALLFLVGASQGPRSVPWAVDVCSALRLTVPLHLTHSQLAFQSQATFYSRGTQQIFPMIVSTHAVTHQQRQKTA
ncbi:hypothetical protein T439DRAFT_172015 [Meredithblackwellia eburnea MCA 4105]